MDLPIISRAAIHARGSKAHTDGRSRDDHRMNWNADAITEWQAGWDEAAARKQRDQAQVRAYQVAGGALA